MATTFRLRSKLQAAMDERNLSVDGLAALTTLSPARIRAAVAAPKPEALSATEMLRIASAMDMPVDQLFTLESTPVGKVQEVLAALGVLIYGVARLVGILLVCYVLASWALANLPRHVPFMSDKEIRDQRLYGMIMLFPSASLDRAVATAQWSPFLPFDPTTKANSTLLDETCRSVAQLNRLNLSTMPFAPYVSQSELNARANCWDYTGRPAQALAVRELALAQMPLLFSDTERKAQKLHPGQPLLEFALLQAAQAACFNADDEALELVAPIRSHVHDVIVHLRSRGWAKDPCLKKLDALVGSVSRGSSQSGR